MKKLFPLVAITLVFSLVLPSFTWAATDQEAKTQLDLRMTAIEDSARSERIVGGATGLIAGGIFGVLAATSNNSTNPGLPVVYGIGAGLFGVLGLITLLAPTQFEKIPQKYRLMPESSDQDLKAKVNFGDVSIDRLATEARNQRVMSGVVMVALGGAEIGLYAANSGSTLSSWGNQFWLYAGILTAGIGIATLLIKTKPETENGSYQDWKHSHQKASLMPRLSFAPIPGGVATGLTVQF